MTETALFNNLTKYHSQISFDQARTLALRSLDRITPEQVTGYYSGCPGCACGCRGNYRYQQEFAQLEGTKRGYAVSEDEIVARNAVKRFLTVLRNRISTQEITEIHFFACSLAIEVGGRQYMVYLCEPTFTGADGSQLEVLAA